MSRSVAIVDVGSPPPNYQRWDTAEVHFHGFAELTTPPGDCVDSPEFTCLGHTWKLSLCPHGYQVWCQGMVSLYLCNMSNKLISKEFSLNVRDSDGREIAYCTYPSDRFPPTAEVDEDGNVVGDDWGDDNFAKRSKILKHLVEGSLIIEVKMRLTDPSQTILPPFVLENPACNLGQKLFMDEESADVVFEIQHQKGEGNARKKAKASPPTFFAHRIVLQKCTPN